jgi:O-antigen/teichoic acid export membrane protein
MKSLKSNIAYQSVYQLFNVIIPLITVPYVSRILGSDGVGIYSYTYATVYYFCAFANLGISTYGIRVIAENSDNRERLSKVFNSLFGLHALLSLASAVLFFAIILITSVEYNNIFYIQLLYVFATMCDISWFFTGIQNIEVTVIRNIVFRILSLICIFLFVKSRNDVAVYVLILGLGTLLGQLSIWPQITKYVNIRWTPLKEYLPHIKPMFITFIPVIAATVYRYMDKFMLGLLSTTSQTGYYEQTEKIISIPASLITAFGLVMLPKISNSLSNKKSAEAQSLVRISLKYSLIAAVAFTFGISGIARIFVPIFFGNEFQSCIQLIEALSVTIIFIAWSQVIRYQYLLPNHKDNACSVILLLGALINIIINAVLIFPLGAMGAVIGTVFAEFSVMVMQNFYVHKSFKMKESVSSCIPFLFIATAMFYIVRFIERIMPAGVVTCLLQVIVGGLFFIVLSFIILKMQKDPLLNMILNNLRKKKLYNE